MADHKKEKAMNIIWPVIKVLFSTAGKKYPAFFWLEAFKTLVEILQPFLGIIISPLLVDELCTTRNVKTLVIYAAILILGECVLLLLVERCNMTLQKYQQRLDNYFSMLLGERAMGLDFQLTEDKAALDQLEKAKTGMTWYSGGAYGVAEQVFKFIGNVIKIGGFVTLITMYAPWLLLVIAVHIGITSYIFSKRNIYELEAYKRLSKINRLFGYFGWNIVDYLSLVGDSSDDIPGYIGIGEKKARAFLDKYGSIQGYLDSDDYMKDDVGHEKMKAVKEKNTQLIDLKWFIEHHPIKDLPLKVYQKNTIPFGAYKKLCIKYSLGSFLDNIFIRTFKQQIERSYGQTN